MRRGLLAAGLALLLLAGCAPAPAPEAIEPPAQAQTQPPTPIPAPTPPPLEPLDFYDFQREVNEARRALMMEEPLPDLTPFTPDYTDELGTFSAAELDVLLAERGVTEGALTPTEAREDVETLFKLLRTTYGAYSYFGGDAAFLPVRTAILAELEDGEALTAEALEEVLRRSLSPLIREGHFTIGGRHLDDDLEQSMYYVPDLYFTDTRGLDMDFVRPTIGPDGGIVYCFAALSPGGAGLPNQIGPYKLGWHAAQPVTNDRSVLFEERERDGLPILVSRWMMEISGVSEGAAQLERFSACGEEYRERPVFCVDVRANPGGSDKYGTQWFRGLMGRYPDKRGVFAEKDSDLRQKVSGGIMSKPHAEGQWACSTSEGAWADRAGTAFVLMDSGMASAGEGFVGDMRMVGNTIFVGSNTSGAYLVANNNSCYLPHSGIRVYFGTGLLLGPGGENIEGVGFLPDLWVNPVDAEDAVVRLCRYYGLI